MRSVAVRLYEAIGLLFPEDVHMPHGATADLPPCLCCRQPSPFPPSKMGWIKTSDEQAIFVVCETCAAACDDASNPDEELERRVIAQLSEPAQPMAIGNDVQPVRTGAERQPAWAARAAKEWTQAGSAARSPRCATMTFGGAGDPALSTAT
jgi:hypothetical protein